MISSLTSRLLKRPHLSAVAIAIALFSILMLIFPLTLSTDDFYWFSNLYSKQGLHFSDFSSYNARLPGWVVFAMFYFHLPGAAKLAVPAIFTFALYACSCGLLFHYFLRQSRVFISSRILFMGTLVFILYPSHYEILYWITCMAYVPGLLLWTLSLYCSSTLLSVVLLTGSFLSGEMFVLPALAAPILAQALVKDYSFKSKVRPLSIWGLSLLGFYTARFFVGLLLNVPAYHYDLNLDLSSFFHQILNAFRQVYSMHFYKIYWIETVIYGLALLGLLYQIFSRKLLRVVQFLILFSISFATTGIYWVYGHPALRALFGAQLIICSFLFYLVSLLEWNSAKKILFLFLITYGAMTAVILNTKSFNHQELESMVVLAHDRMQNCPEPCELKLENLDQSLKSDWILDKNFWIDFMNYVKNQNHIEKQIHFIL